MPATPRPPFSRLWLVLAAAAALPAQGLLDPKSPEAARSIEIFESLWAAPPQARLQASFSFVKPFLGYNLRYYAGYDIYLPAAQFDLARGVTFSLIACIEPSAGPKTYLFQRQSSPPAPRDGKPLSVAKGLSLHLGGGFYAGPGRYAYRILLSDQDGRFYLRSGSFEIKRGREAASLAPNTVVPVGAPVWNGFAEGAPGGHVTVMVHAAPILPRRVLTRLQPYDRYVLLTSLGALLSRGGFSSAHVIVFDLAGRRILFDEENFDRNSMRRLRRRLEEADFGAISFQTLAEGPSPQRLAENILARAAQQLKERETLVFLGPAWMPSRGRQPVPAALKESLPRVHYLAMVPRTVMPQDTINDLVRALKGRVHAIYSPQDFIAALGRLSPGG